MSSLASWLCAWVLDLKCVCRCIASSCHHVAEWWRKNPTNKSQPASRRRGIPFGRGGPLESAGRLRCSGINTQDSSGSALVRFCKQNSSRSDCWHTFRGPVGVGERYGMLCCSTRGRLQLLSSYLPPLQSDVYHLEGNEYVGVWCKVHAKPTSRLSPLKPQRRNESWSNSWIHEVHRYA